MTCNCGGGATQCDNMEIENHHKLTMSFFTAIIIQINVNMYTLPFKKSSKSAY